MKKKLKSLSVLGLLFFFSCLQSDDQKTRERNDEFVIFDHHVHIMSPNLVSDWQNSGISFSRPDHYYSNIDTIMNVNRADKIKLIGMGYVYGNSEFYRGNQEYSKVKMENDFLFECANQYKNRIQPFFAIDPLKDYAIEEIERCLLINPSSGLKLHFSSSQIYLTEPEHLEKIQSIFKTVSESNVPVLLHFDNWHPEFGKPDIEIFIKKILRGLEPIHLTIAHFGTSGGFNQKTKDVLETFIDFFENDSLVTKHTILFDISAVALDKDSEGVNQLTTNEFKELKHYCDKIGFDKIVFGTDYPLYSSEEYLEILMDKLHFSQSELKEIME